MAPVSMTSSYLKARFQGHDITLRQITLKKWYKIGYSYNGGPIESRIWSTEPPHFE